MRRAALIRKIGDRARVARVEWDLVREGRRHELWRCGSQQVTIPRHAEINEYTCEGIFKELQSMLGENWWRR